MNARDSSPLWQDCRQFLDYCGYLNRSPQTVRTYEQVLSDFTAYCTKTNRPVTRVEDLTLPVITAFLAWKRTHTSASTLAKYASCLRSMLRYFSLHEDRAVLVYDKIQLPKLQRHAPRNVPTAEDIVHLFRSIPQDTPSRSARSCARHALLLNRNAPGGTLCARPRRSAFGTSRHRPTAADHHQGQGRQRPAGLPPTGSSTGRSRVLGDPRG